MISEQRQPDYGKAVAPQVRPASESLLTLDQVAAMLGISKAWVRDHATRRSPRIPVVRFGGHRAVLRFRPQDIQAFIVSHLLPAEENP